MRSPLIPVTLTKASALHLSHRSKGDSSQSCFTSSLIIVNIILPLSVISGIKSTTVEYCSYIRVYTNQWQSASFTLIPWIVFFDRSFFCIPLTARHTIVFVQCHRLFLLFCFHCPVWKVEIIPTPLIPKKFYYSFNYFNTHHLIFFPNLAHTLSCRKYPSASQPI
jgi:hypothetical protein